MDTLTHDGMTALWSQLRARVEAEEGLAENIRSGMCGDNLDAVLTRAGGSAQFCDLWTFANEDGTEWDRAKLAGLPSVQPPPGLTWDSLRDMGWIRGSHVWATLDGRHYDIEAPEGVDNPFDLNDIRCGMVATVSKVHPDLFERLRDEPWWRVSISVAERTDAMIAAIEESGSAPAP